jgi:putative ABC transport system permease protein
MRTRALWEEPYSELFIPAAQEARWSYYVTVRGERDAAALMPSIRRIIHDADPAMPIADVGTMDERLAAARAPQRFRATLISVLGLVALFLAVVGVYGVMANAVADRRREIGIRMAIGESSGRVRWLVVNGAMRIAGAGALLGVLLALGAARWLAGFLIGVQPRDPAMLALSASLLLCAALIAAYLPARRASRIDPAIVLRTD